jgi:hypothetical protein
MKKITLAALLLLPWAGWQNVWGQTDGEGTGTETTTLTDVTSEYINDATCENLNAWTRENSSAGAFATQNNTGMGENNTYIECWRNGGGWDKWNNTQAFGHGVFDIHQMIQSLPAGKYKLSAYIIATQQNSRIADHAKEFVKDVYLYAGDVSVPIATNDGTPETFAVSFYSDGKTPVLIGCKNTKNQNFGYCSSGCNWFGMDNYKLEQYQSYDVESDLQTYLADAANYTEDQLNYGLWQKLQAAIKAGQDATDEDGKLSALAALQAAVSDARITVDRELSKYEIYKEINTFCKDNSRYTYLLTYQALKKALKEYEEYEGIEYDVLENLATNINNARNAFTPQQIAEYVPTEVGQEFEILNEPSKNGDMDGNVWKSDVSDGNFKNNTNGPGAFGELADSPTHQYNYIEKWTGTNYTQNQRMIYQTVGNLPVGNYTVEACVFGCESRNENGNWNNYYMDDVHIDFFANDMQEEVSRYMTNRKLSLVEVMDGNLTFGLRTSADNQKGNWCGISQVKLTYAGVSKTMLEDLIAQAEGVQSRMKGDNGILGQAISQAREALKLSGDNPQEDLNNSYASLERAMNASLTVDNTFDMDFMVNNADCAVNQQGWSTDVNPNGNFRSLAPDGNMHYAHTYTQSYFYEIYKEPSMPDDTKLIYQQIKGLTNGYYRVTLSAYARGINTGYYSEDLRLGVYAFANEGISPVKTIYMDKIEVIGEVTDGVLDLGIKTVGSCAANWAGIGDVHLEYLGSEKPVEKNVAIWDYEAKNSAEGWKTDYAKSILMQNFMKDNFKTQPYKPLVGEAPSTQFIEVFHGTPFEAGRRVLYQTVEGLDPGVYTVSAYILDCYNAGQSDEDMKGCIYLYGNKQHTAVPAQKLFRGFSVDCVVGEDGTLEFGLRTGVTELENLNWIALARATVRKKGEAVGVTLDEASEASVTGTQTNVLCNRTLKAGVWNTLCLPYEINDLSRFTAVYELSSLEKIKGMATSYTIGFSKTESKMEAGQPYIVKVDADTQLFEASADMASDVAGSKEVTAADGVKAQMIGAYSPVTVAANQDNYVFATDNKFYYMDKDTQMKGYRAYIHLDNGTTGEPASLIFSLDEDDIQTGVVPVADVRTGEERVNVYSISGVRVREGVKSAEALNSLPSGIYIVNGKKYMVK